MPTQAYRLRIRSADNTTDTLVVTSVRGGTNPYIVDVPSGDGQEVDLLTGAVRTGAYVVQVIDVVTGSTPDGTLRLVTSQLYDGTEEYLLLENGDKILLESGDPIELELNNAEFGRPHLLSRAAFLEMSTDGGSNWTVWQAGYLSNVRQVDAIRYAFTISNTRRVEQTKQLFTWSDSAERAAFPKRGCIVGGPIIGGFGVGGDRTTDSGGWEFYYLNTSGSAAAPKQGDIIALEYRAGYFWPEWSRKAVPGPGQATDFWNNILPYRDVVPGDQSLTGADFKGLNDRDLVASYPQLTAAFTYTVGSNTYTMYGTVRALFPDYTFNPFQEIQYPGGNVDVRRFPFGYANNKRGRLFIELEAPNPSNTSQPWDALPARDTVGRIRLVASQVDESSPLYLDEHPVDIAKACYGLINITVDSASEAIVRSAIGVNTRVAMRISKPVTMAEFLEKAIFGPFGFAARINVKNIGGVITPVVEFFVTRSLEYSPPTYTIADADLVGDTPPPIFDLDEATVVTSFVVEQQTLLRVADVQNDKNTPPPDGIAVTTQSYQLDNGDTSTFSTRIVEYKIPGLVHEVANWTSTLKAFAQGVALEGFDRFGRGAPSMEVQVLRTSAAAAAQIGDLVYLNVGYYPNKNYRIGESNVGPRVAQIVRREDRPEGPMFKLVDAGVFNQPSIAPTITITASTSDPRRIAQFTVTNAAAINNNADVTTVIEYATGSSAPGTDEHGTRFTRYAPLTLPAGPVLLPAVTPGTTVHVRARTEQAGLFPSLWTNWQTVTLDSWSVVKDITVTNITNESAVINWDTDGNEQDWVDLFISPGTVAPSSWQSFRINSFPPKTTRASVNLLTPSSAYVIGVAFRDVVGDTRGAVVTQTFSTIGTTSGTAPRPAGIAIIPGIADASLQQGVVLGMWQAAGSDVLIIERALDVAGVPGTYEEIAAVPSYTETYVDYLPRTGATLWYRLQHKRSGEADSAYMPAVTIGGSPYFGLSAVATGVPASVSRPDAVSPVIAVTTDESGSTATVTLSITDSQYRVTQVRFRERTNGGAWSAYTVDTTVPYSYSATIPLSGFVDIEYEVSGYNGAGIFGILAAGQESFDANTNANIVSASGTFSLAGALTLAVQGDTDTNSFKYAVATTNWADDAAAYTAAQAGTLVNARNGTITLSGPYSVGTIVYVAIAGYTGSSAGGTVSGPYRYAFINGASDTIYAQCLAEQTAASATEITVTVTATAPNGTPQVRLASLAGTATRTAGATAGTLVASGSSWTFARGAFDSGPSQAEFEAVLAGAITDADFIEIPEQGRDTVPLTSRARVLSTDNTSVTVRYAVADPFPQGANSVTVGYQNLGTGGVSPASGGTITPAATLTEDAGTYIDYTITRPAFEAGAGRVTFTATAANRVSDSDAVDVPAVERDTVPLTSRARVTATSNTQVTVRYAVADPFPQGTNSVTVTYQNLGTAGVSPASGGTLTPASTLTEAAGTYIDYTIDRPAFSAGAGRVTFTATAANRVSDQDAVDVPAIERDTVPLATRARVTATSATSVTVRVAVADPYPQGTNSVSLAYTTTGLGTVSPTSPQLITPAATFTEASGTFVDFTVPRPSAGSGMGRITFTATATGRVESSDAVDVTPSILVYSLCEATQTNANETTIEVTVTASADNGTPEVRYTGLTGPTSGGASKFSGPNLNVLSPSGSVWVFTRGSFEAGPSQASFESVLAGAVTDIDFITIPEQQRDTVPLICRARVIDVNATEVTVRVAVADPYPQGTNSATIAYSTLGLGSVSPATGQTVTPASTLTEASGTFVDFTVPRPAANQPPGRITFTATAANRTSDSDATDVVPQNPLPASLTVSYLIFSDIYTIFWAGGTGTTVTVSIDGGAYAAPSASPIKVPRNDYTETDKTYTFKGTGAAGDVITNTVVVARRDPVIPNLAQILSAQFENGFTPGDGGGSVDVSWVDSGMPVGVTYDIYLTDITGDPITASSASDLGNSASPVTVSVALGAGAEATCTIEAYDGATLVATYTFRSIIPI
jgi:hypothetical protein